MFHSQGPMGDAEYLAAFRHVIMPIAYEVGSFILERKILIKGTLVN